MNQRRSAISDNRRSGVALLLKLAEAPDLSSGVARSIQNPAYLPSEHISTNMLNMARNTAYAGINATASSFRHAGSQIGSALTTEGSPWNKWWGQQGADAKNQFEASMATAGSPTAFDSGKVPLDKYYKAAPGPHPAQAPKGYAEATELTKRVGADAVIGAALSPLSSAGLSRGAWGLAAGGARAMGAGRWASGGAMALAGAGAALPAALADTAIAGQQFAAPMGYGGKILEKLPWSENITGPITQAIAKHPDWLNLGVGATQMFPGSPLTSLAGKSLMAAGAMGQAETGRQQGAARDASSYQTFIRNPQAVAQWRQQHEPDAPLPTQANFTAGSLGAKYESGLDSLKATSQSPVAYKKFRDDPATQQAFTAETNALDNTASEYEKLLGADHPQVRQLRTLSEERHNLEQKRPVTSGWRDPADEQTINSRTGYATEALRNDPYAKDPKFSATPNLRAVTTDPLQPVKLRSLATFTADAEDNYAKVARDPEALKQLVASPEEFAKFRSDTKYLGSIVENGVGDLPPAHVTEVSNLLLRRNAMQHQIETGEPPSVAALRIASLNGKPPLPQDLSAAFKNVTGGTMPAPGPTTETSGADAAFAALSGETPTAGSSTAVPAAPPTSVVERPPQQSTAAPVPGTPAATPTPVAATPTPAAATPTTKPAPAVAALPTGPRAAEPGMMGQFTKFFGELEPWQQAGLVLGIPLAIAGMAEGAMGGNPMAGLLMALLGGGIAAYSSNAFGMASGVLTSQLKSTPLADRGTIGALNAAAKTTNALSNVKLPSWMGGKSLASSSDDKGSLMATTLDHKLQSAVKPEDGWKLKVFVGHGKPACMTSLQNLGYEEPAAAAVYEAIKRRTESKGKA